MTGPALPLRVRWLPAAERVAAAAIWRELEARTSVRLACSWRWTETWLDHYGDLVPHRFAVGERSGTPVGIVLVSHGVGERRARVPVRTLHLGTAGEPGRDSVFVERNGLPVVREHRAAFARALLGSLAADGGWDELLLDGFTEEDAGALLEAAPFDVRREPCRTFDLRAAAATGGDVLALLSAKTRSNFRRSHKWLGVAAVEWAETAGAARAILDELALLHQQRWETRGEPGVFASPRFAGFHRDLAGRLAETGEVCLFRISDERETLSCLYGFIEDGRLMSYQHGTPIEAGQRSSPGLVAEVLCMQAAYDRGIAVYDHLSGDSDFKRWLSNGTETLIWAATRRGRLRWAAVDTARGARRVGRAVLGRRHAGAR
jgi:CelD/BcsL family acetyltransferase involved in cellulose biosynthesis